MYYVHATNTSPTPFIFLVVFAIMIMHSMYQQSIEVQEWSLLL